MAVEVPTPTGPARPDLTILETRIYRGPNIWSYQQAIHLVVDLGSLEDYPTVSLPGFTEQLLEAVPGLHNHTCSPGPPWWFRRAAARGHLARPRRRARRAPAPDPRRARVPARQDPRGQGRARPLQRHLQLHRRDRRRRRRQAVGPAAQPPRRARGRLRLRDGVQRLPAPGRAGRLRPVDGGHPRGGGVARHPLHPPQLRLARPARPGRPRPAHPRHDDVEDRRPRRRHRQ